MNSSTKQSASGPAELKILKLHNILDLNIVQCTAETSEQPARYRVGTTIN